MRTYDGVVAQIVHSIEETPQLSFFHDGTSWHNLSLDAGLVDIEITVINAIT